MKQLYGLIRHSSPTLVASAVAILISSVMPSASAAPADQPAAPDAGATAGVTSGVAAAAQNAPGETALVVLIYDQSCRSACTRVRPIIQELLSKYSQKLQYVELDADNAGSSKVAKSLKISGFFDEHEDWYPAVGIFTPQKHKLVKEIDGVKSKEAYAQAIDQALQKAAK